MFRTLCHSFYTDKVFLPCFIFGIIPHYYFEKSIYHNGFITKYYPPNVLSNVLLKKHWETTYFSHEMQGYGFSPVCILKCPTRPKYFEKDLSYYLYLESFFPTCFCIILSKFYSASWLNWSKTKLFEHLQICIQLEEFDTFVASMLFSWPCNSICKFGMIF